METFVVNHAPAPDEIARWSDLPGTRDYLFQIDDPQTSDLSALSELRGAGKLTVETTDFPNQDTVAEWRKLANQGVEFVVMNVNLPTDGEIDILNRIGVSRCTFILDYYPDPADSQRMSRLTCSLTVEFAADAYPKYAEKDGLVALPVKTPLVFAQDMWPYYTHMDVFNLIPQQIRLFVRDMYPPSDELQYLHNIHRLEGITVDETYDPNSPDDWKAFGDVPVTWQSEDYVPSAAGLAAFESGGPNRQFILDSTRQITDDELKVLRESPFPVRWIHDAP